LQKARRNFKRQRKKENRVCVFRQPNRAKVGLLELAKQLGNVSQAMMGIGVLSSQGPIEPIVWDRDDALVAR